MGKQQNETTAKVFSTGKELVLTILTRVQDGAGSGSVDRPALEALHFLEAALGVAEEGETANAAGMLELAVEVLHETPLGAAPDTFRKTYSRRLNELIGPR